MDVVALVNDTTGTQMALGLSDPDCFVGLILGKSAEGLGGECIPTIWWENVAGENCAILCLNL